MEVDEIIEICKKIYTKDTYYFNARVAVVDNYNRLTYLSLPIFKKYHHQNYKHSDLAISSGNGIVYWNGHYAELCDNKGNIIPFPEGVFTNSDLELARKIIYEE